MSQYCIKCGKELKEGTKFCPNCGTQQDIRAVKGRIISEGEKLEDIVSAFQNKHDDASFEALYKASYKKIYAYIQMMTRDNVRTEDIVQNSYIICYKKIDQLKEASKFMAWMKNIAYHNLSDSMNNKEVLLSDSQSADEDVDFFDNITDDKMEMPEKAAEDKNLKSLILKTINSLPEKQRMAVFAFYYEDRSIKDIAEALGAPENTVKTYLNRARKSMNASMKSYADSNGLKMVPFAVVPFMFAMFNDEASACELQATDGAKLFDKILGSLNVQSGAAAGSAAGTTVAGTTTAGNTAVTGAVATGVATGSVIGIKTLIAAVVGAVIVGGVGTLAVTKVLDGRNDSNDITTEENVDSDEGYGEENDLTAENEADTNDEAVEGEEDISTDATEAELANSKMVLALRMGIHTSNPDGEEKMTDNQGNTITVPPGLDPVFLNPKNADISYFPYKPGEIIYVTEKPVNEQTTSDLIAEYINPHLEEIEGFFNENVDDTLYVISKDQTNVEEEKKVTIPRMDVTKWFPKKMSINTDDGVIDMDLTKVEMSVSCATIKNIDAELDWQVPIAISEKEESVSNFPKGSLIVPSTIRIEFYEDGDAVDALHRRLRGEDVETPVSNDSEMDLKQKLADAAGVTIDKIAEFSYNDFDKDGVHEAFGTVEREDGWVYTDTWFVNPNKAEKIADGLFSIGSYDINDSELELLDTGERIWLLITEFNSGTGIMNTEYIYSVKDGNYYESQISKEIRGDFHTIEYESFKDNTLVIHITELGANDYDPTLHYYTYDADIDDFIKADTEVPRETGNQDVSAVWGEEVTEYYDENLGIHFYLPADLTVTISEPQMWGDAGKSIYVSGRGMKNEYLFSTTYVTREVNANSDAAEADYRLVSDENGRIYHMAFASDMDYPEPSSSVLSFVNQYADRIAEAAWVDPKVQPRYVSFSVADNACKKSEESYWLPKEAPNWIESAEGGYKEISVGSDIAAGNYEVRCTFGAGTVIILDAGGNTKYSFSDDWNTNAKSDTIGKEQSISLSDGDVIKLAANAADCYAVTFSKN